MKAQEFLSQREKSFKYVQIRNTITTLLLGYLFYSLLSLLFPVVKNQPPIIFIGACMVSVSLFIGLSFKIAQIRLILEQRTLEKIKKETIIQAVKGARQNDNYEELNILLLDKNSHLFIIQIGYFICQHFYGSWINEDKIEYPSAWGVKFFDDLRVFFKKEKELKYEDLNNWNTQAAFLATVKKSVVLEVVNHFE